MPPRNPTRSLLREEALRDRIVYERERRGWTLEGLAKRLTDAGCPINQSAIYKIEKGDPPRRITVDELVGFSIVFDESVADLLLPMEVIEERRLVELYASYVRARQAAVEAERRTEALLNELEAQLNDPEKRERLGKAMGVAHERDRDLPFWVWEAEKTALASDGRQTDG